MRQSGILTQWTSVCSRLILFMVAVCSCQEWTQAQVAPVVNQSAQQSLSGTATITGNGIDYHGGPMMVGSHDVYLIWYGNWNGNSAVSFLPSLISGLNGSPYFSINTTYSNGVPQSVPNGVALSGQTFDNYSQGTVLDDGKMQAIVSNSFGIFGTDPNGIYFVLASADVNETSHGGFCTGHCGWHGHASLNGTDIMYSFVGNGDRCISNCAVLNQTVSPNGNPGGDEMASVISHELSETVTDPDLNAWFDSNGNENADKCAYTYGSTFTTGNGAAANVTLGGFNFLIQQNWVNDGGGYCAMSTTGNPFSYRVPRDQQLACYGIAFRPNFPSNCRDITDPNDQQMCYGISSNSQTQCQSITDRNLQLACYGMAIAPSYPSNCRDITDPQMQNFCYGVSSNGSMSNCNSVTDNDTRALCLGMSLSDSSYCSSITNTNNRLFCQGVASHSQTPCTSIQ